MKRLKLVLRYLYNKRTRIICNSYYKGLLKINGIRNKPIDGETKWINKWSVLGQSNPIYYRLFSHYIGCDDRIVAEDICRSVVEPILNPRRYAKYYGDKNIFDKLFQPGILPKTIFRKMGGFYYDAEYNHINIYDNNILLDTLFTSDCSKIVIKPTLDSCSGNGVKVFQIDNGKWRDLLSGDILTFEYLNTNYDADFIVQECLEQADFMSYYCSTSVNTLRLTLYRSIKTDKCYIPSAVIRIGKEGSLVDNAHAGGSYVGIHVENGVLCNSVLNQFGQSTKMFNAVDFSQEHKIPNWEEIVDFAKSVGAQIPHHRLLALDIMVDKAGRPRLVEFNSDVYSVWLFQFTMGPAFGQYTDEIIAYCQDNIDNAEHIIKL